jgi:hypothetical protein
VVAAGGCLAVPSPSLGQIEFHTTGLGVGTVFVTRTLPGGCDGGAGAEPCVLRSACTGGGTGYDGNDPYLCGVAFEPGYPVTLAASAAPGSSFDGWNVTVFTPAANALPPDDSATKQLTLASGAKNVDVLVRFDLADAGSD